MKVQVDPDLCISCGACISLAPGVYEWDEEGKAKAVGGEVAEDQQDEAKDALEGCPTEAIKEV